MYYKRQLLTAFNKFNTFVGWQIYFVKGTVLSSKSIKNKWKRNED